jgi:hypothetical protein
VCKELDDRAKKNRKSLSEVLTGDKSLVDGNPVKVTRN